jgi:hypothetical protein
MKAKMRAELRRVMNSDALHDEEPSVPKFSKIRLDIDLGCGRFSWHGGRVTGIRTGLKIPAVCLFLMLCPCKQ